jgi:hypothetical protein
MTPTMTQMGAIVVNKFVIRSVRPVSQTNSHIRFHSTCIVSRSPSHWAALRLGAVTRNATATPPAPPTARAEAHVLPRRM